MILYPAIDLYEGQAVRLYKGDYAQKTVYSENPVEVARDFKNCGATHVHLVDLEGAKSGGTPNYDVIRRIKSDTGLFAEVGGGVRDMDTIRKYLESGLDRVILGTAAAGDPDFVKRAVDTYGDRIAVGVDLKDGFVAIKGWTEKTEIRAFDFCAQMQDIGVKTLICTDISRDGAMRGTNRALYSELSQRFDMDIIASGGVSTMDDIRALKAMHLHGAIIGKAYYTGAINLREAIEVAT
ncbi:MAG: 1-(5-phosphoribosyl)-5-[(5-phosphoribosylamino)methylideneamino]imidazole-4-carboxamide isomerase [Christensenellales bacterium]|jgi:phosphoribosylformimino-5-aminoimidazole carboxamide ribotide isomerase